MATKAFRGLVGSVMILVLSGCDNVEWAGFTVELMPPPPATGLSAAARDSLAESEGVSEPTIELPVNPVLYMGTRDGSRVSVHPVGQFVGDSMLPLQPGDPVEGFSRALIERDLSPGTALTLFSKGVRAGTLRLDSASVATGPWCAPTPVGSGIAEIIPAAATATRFLALTQSDRDPVGYGTYHPVEDTYEQRTAGITLANQALMQTGAIWPPAVLETRVDMQAVPLDGDPSGAIAATFLVDDRLAVGPPGSGSAYSIFVLGRGGPENYELDYLWYRPVAESGKAAPVFFEQLDWDADGQSEILLEVFGDSVRWEAVLDRGPEGWRTVFESRCAG